MILLDAGMFVVDVQRRGDSFGNHSRTETMAAVARDTAIEDELDPIRTAEVEVLANHLFEEKSARDGPVEHLSQRELGLEDGHVVPVARLAVLGFEGMRQPAKPLAQQPVDPRRR